MLLLTNPSCIPRETEIEMRNSRRPSLVAISAFVLVLHLGAVMLRSGQTPLIDEGYHFDQIGRFLSGNWTLNLELSLVPGFHFLIFLITKLFGISDFSSVRIISFLLSFASVPIFYLAAKHIDPQNVIPKTAQFAFLPIVFPFFSLVYSDVFSLTLLLLSLLFSLKDKPTLSALIGIFSLAVRQTNIVWFVFILILSYVNRKGFAFSLKNIVNFLLSHFMFLVGIILFGEFAYLNQGIVTGARIMQPSGGFFPSNIYFLLFLFTPLFLPFVIGNFTKILLFVQKKKSLLIPIIVVVYFFYMATFTNSHPWNHYTFFLRNKLLILFTSNVLYKTIFFAVMVISLLSLAVTKLYKKSFYLFYPATLLFLAPLWLVEQRYFFVPLTFFLLFKNASNIKVEWIAFVYFVVMSLIFYVGILRLWFFL